MIINIINLNIRYDKLLHSKNDFDGSLVLFLSLNVPDCLLRSTVESR